MSGAEPLPEEDVLLPEPKVFEKPLGMRDFLPDMAERKRALEQRIQRVMERWGYREIITPTLEYYDTVGAASATMTDKMFKLLDREGHTLVLRPDMTAPIARIAASLDEANFPLRFLYHGSVFRVQEQEAGRNAEFFQTGVELLGEASPEADAEVVALAMRCLEEAGVTGFQLALGHVGLLDGLLAENVSDEPLRQALKNDLLRRDHVTFRRRLDQSGMPDERRERLLALLPVYESGQVQELSWLVSGERSQAAWENLLDIGRLLKVYGVWDKVLLDLTLIGFLNYYTGVVFEGFAEGYGFHVLSGGRYDHLLQRFGAHAPATGFALKIDRLMEISDYAGEPPERVVVAYRPEHQERAIARTLQLREERPRWAVEMIALGRDFRPEQKAAFEKRQRQRGVHRVLYVEGADEA